MAGKQYTDKRVLKEVQLSGRIVLSLDGAQPVKKEPSLWVFSDRLTGNIILARNLESAPAHVLRALFQEIEKIYGVPIVAIISDKQKNIVNAIKQFRPNIPHAYCQYHFLNHIVEPIASKDSHLKKILRKVVRLISIVQNSKYADSNRLYKLFYPISEELKCAISTRGNRFDGFPGIEAYANLEHIISRLEQFENWELIPKVSRTLNALLATLKNLLQENRHLWEEITILIPDFLQIRKILGKRKKTSTQIKKEVNKLVYKLQGRLKRRRLEYNPQNIKWQQPSFKLSKEEIWQ